MRSESDFQVVEVPWSENAETLRAIRREVFVEEQQVPEALEWDGLDPQCRHVLARTSRGTAIATGRLLPDGHVGRMAVLRQWRRRGVGRAVLDELLRIGRARGDVAAILHAQTHAIEFYRRAGFAVIGEEFMEAGIPHVKMQMRLAAETTPGRLL